MPCLLLSARKCSQCLCTRGRIVSGARAAEIIREVRAKHIHFQCHKAEDEVVHCRGVHDLFGSRAHNFAQLVGIPIIEVDMDAE